MAEVTPFSTPAQKLAHWFTVDDDGCKLYSGPPGVTSRYAYPGIIYHGEKHGAHVWAWLLSGREIPDGYTIDHACHNEDPDCPGGECKHRRCYELTHLACVSLGQNVLNGKGPSAVNAARTHCVKGHKLDARNVYRTPDGRRQCRECLRRRSREYAQRKAAAK